MAHLTPLRGAVAQLGERRVRNAKVVGSIPIGSTIFSAGEDFSAFFLLFGTTTV